MTKKMIVQILVVVCFTVGAAFFVFSTGRVDFEKPSHEELNEAVALLQNSLSNPRFGYVNFLNSHNRLVGSTPLFKDVISGDSTVAGGDYVVFNVTVPNDGLYYFSLDYELPYNSFNDFTVSVLINGEVQFVEATSINIPIFWRDETKNFPTNRFGDEVVPPQIQVSGIHNIFLFDAMFTSATPLLFFLEAGDNEILIRNDTTRVLWLGDLHVFSQQNLPSYSSTGGSSYNGFITVNATHYTKTNSPFVQLEGRRNPALLPFHPVDRLINIVNLAQVGNEVFFEVDIPFDGYFGITINATPETNDFPSFITLRINGEIPFYEVKDFELQPRRDGSFSNYTFQSQSGEPFMFFLTAGIHELSIRTELAPVSQELSDLRLLIDHLNHLGLEVRRITGREVDPHRTWRLSRYIPGIADYLDAYDTILRNMVFQLNEFSPHGGNVSMSNQLITAISLLETLRENPDEMPSLISVLNGVEASILQMVGIALDSLVDVGLSINNIYIGRVYDLPRERAAFHQTFWAGVQNLWATYTSDRFVVRNRDEALNVWVNYSYLHVDILQRLVDTQFTPQTGIEVNLSVMPDVNRLIMARAAGTNPDVALGVPAWMPFEMGARGALYDLTSFDDFWYFMGNLVPGAMIPYIFNDGVFAIPETVGFAATVYRTDILYPMNLTAPDTWEDVAAMQSELQRFDMSFFKPIASGVGYKWFFQTSPLIYQYGGRLFNPDGLSTAINEPNAVQAITFLGDLFTTFALDEQVPAFFNAFRFGQNPVGIIDPAAYMLLLTSAPELLGQWDLAPFPGIMQENGDIYRWFIANGMGSLIFDDTNMADDAWQFLKWYLSAETQTDFAFSLFSNFNILWLSSNIEALHNSPIEDGHRQIILDSMQWLRDVPRSPGQYMLERRLSDIWNEMVFQGVPAQMSIDMGVIDINREFRRKMVEFGFIDNEGNELRPYIVRELDWVLYMVESARR